MTTDAAAADPTLDPALDALITRFVGAIQAGDVATVREIYAPDAAIWHNFDEREQTVDENVVTLADLHRLDLLARAPHGGRARTPGHRPPSRVSCPGSSRRTATARR